MKVVIADPPAFTPWYDHELAAALARGGADVELATSRFRFGETPAPDGYRRSERFYPLSSRVFRRSRARLPLKAVEHLAVIASLARLRTDVLHVQWLALPDGDGIGYVCGLDPVSTDVRLSPHTAGSPPHSRRGAALGLLLSGSASPTIQIESAVGHPDSSARSVERDGWVTSS